VLLTLGRKEHLDPAYVDEMYLADKVEVLRSVDGLDLVCLAMQKYRVWPSKVHGILVRASGAQASFGGCIRPLTHPFPFALRAPVEVGGSGR